MAVTIELVTTWMFLFKCGVDPWCLLFFCVAILDVERDPTRPFVLDVSVGHLEAAFEVLHSSSGHHLVSTEIDWLPAGTPSLIFE